MIDLNNDKCPYCKGNSIKTCANGHVSYIERENLKKEILIKFCKNLILFINLLLRNNTLNFANNIIINSLYFPLSTTT